MNFNKSAVRRCERIQQAHKSRLSAIMKIYVKHESRIFPSKKYDLRIIISNSLNGRD